MQLLTCNPLYKYQVCEVHGRRIYTSMEKLVETLSPQSRSFSPVLQQATPRQILHALHFSVVGINAQRQGKMGQIYFTTTATPFPWKASTKCDGGANTAYNEWPEVILTWTLAQEPPALLHCIWYRICYCTYLGKTWLSRCWNPRSLQSGCSLGGPLLCHPHLWRVRK